MYKLFGFIGLIIFTIFLIWVAHLFCKTAEEHSEVNPEVSGTMALVVFGIYAILVQTWLIVMK